MTFIGLMHALLNYVNYAYINQKQPHLVRFEVNSSKETRSNYKVSNILTCILYCISSSFLYITILASTYM